MRFADGIDGAPIELPSDPQVRAVTRLSRRGRPVAALIHDPLLETDSALVEGLAASSLMMLENARLGAELHTSRARPNRSRNCEPWPAASIRRCYGCSV